MMERKRKYSSRVVAVLVVMDQKIKARSHGDREN